MANTWLSAPTALALVVLPEVPSVNPAPPVATCPATARAFEPSAVGVVVLPLITHFAPALQGWG